MNRLALPVLVAGLFCTALTLRAGVRGDSLPPASPLEPVRATAAPAAAAPAVMSYDAQNDTIKQFCVGCHNDNMKKGELSLMSFDAARAGERAEIAEKMVRKVRAG